MKTKIPMIAMFFAAQMISSAVHAQISITGTLGITTAATDIALFKCSPQQGITVASTHVKDNTPINAIPNINVQIAKSTSTTTCPAVNATSWTPVKTTTGEGTWSLRTATIPVSQTPPNNYYCIKITKATAIAVIDDYSLNHACEIVLNSLTQQPSTFLGYTQNQ
ncbi:MAG: hypothetical protein HOP36_02080 [Methyloglobulus sp.]|nr:hypothetical protein [Methyloglobulus sp.]